MSSPTNMICDVYDFMTAFDQHPDPTSDGINAASLELGNQLIAEEVAELYEATDDLESFASVETLSHFAKEACDLIYVLIWTLNKLNVPIEACWNEVQRSNMAKLNADGSYSKHASGPKIGKVKKPDSWTPANMEPIIAKAFPLLSRAKHEAGN